MSSSDSVLPYFELSWSILSTFDLLHVVAALLIVPITGFSTLWAVPVVCSITSAIANGLCYVAYYSDASTNSKVIAAALADIFWLIQEAGLSFYSYDILRRFLQGKSRIIFFSLFWFLMVSIVAFRTAILSQRVLDILSSSTARQFLINELHIGYFGSLALVETVSAFFLLRIFIQGKRQTRILPSGSSLFKQLILSTEVRVSSLAIIGIGRTITYHFHTTAQSATNLAGQLDRLLVTCVNYFPMIMLIDLLATRIANAEDTSNATSARQRSTKEDPVTIELNRVNNEARKDIDRQTFVRIKPVTDEQNSIDSTTPCQKAILKSSTFTVEREEVGVHQV
ncbi:uncharacterized protein yc1106_02118 [Curvularia clavata]|uniref:Uncharacterized protein n=1 Tax=Curvularia clavata TaxID=95742 RepID=A0A9Q9DQM2_CURCL|nr:uncharacterized protein yc1106_02118 [Curvularia clavata]